MPVHIIAQSKLAKMHTLGCGAPEAPAAQMVLGDVERGHRPNHDVVERHRDCGCDFIATENPRHSDRQQRLERIERGEAEEYSDSRPERDRVWRVSNRHQRHVMRSEPLLQSRKWFWQSRLVNNLGCLLRLVRFQR